MLLNHTVSAGTNVNCLDELLAEIWWPPLAITKLVSNVSYRYFTTFRKQFTCYWDNWATPHIRVCEEAPGLWREMWPSHPRSVFPAESWKFQFSVHPCWDGAVQSLTAAMLPQLWSQTQKSTTLSWPQHRPRDGGGKQEHDISNHAKALRLIT